MIIPYANESQIHFQDDSNLQTAQVIPIENAQVIANENNIVPQSLNTIACTVSLCAIFSTILLLGIVFYRYFSYN